VLERETFSGSPFGTASITIDAGSTSPAASLNRNRIVIGGTEGGLTEQGLGQLVDRFRSRGIPRFFVWLSPGPQMDRVREWLAALSFRRVPWTRYPTLLLKGSPEPARPHGFEIRPADLATFASCRAALGKAVFDGYARTLGKPGFHHYIAFDGARPVAAAALAIFEDIGYLTFAGTGEADRGRGAQSALIAHRVAVARSLGCAWIMSQTLTMLEQSLSNLKRAGFREIYEQEVFELSGG
jgi:GNAT superfamily N-acetyltransferase